AADARGPGRQPVPERVSGLALRRRRRRERPVWWQPGRGGGCRPARRAARDAIRLRQPAEVLRAAPHATAAAGAAADSGPERGAYHRAPDRAWDYLPTYLAKLARVRGWLNALPAGTPVLDAGCGEGVLVEEFAGRLAIEGVDANYTSPHVQRGSLLALPFPDG